MAAHMPGLSTPCTDTQNVGFCLALLGGFSVWLGEHEVPEGAFEKRKARHLLKVLALQPGHRLHREQALDLLWPELDPRSAAAQLYKAIYYIRQAFATAQPPCPPEDLLDLHAEVLTLAAPAGVHTDIEAFEHLAREATHTRDLALLQRAAACYKGDLLPEDLYEEWTIMPREALRERFLEVLVALGEGYLAIGYLDEAADAFRQVLAREPAREDAHRGLMRVFALQGSRDRALRQYRLCIEVLARELDVEPLPETTQLYQDILNRKIQPRREVSAPPVASGFSPAPTLPPLVGRQAEMKTITELLDRLARGQGAVLALEGSAGIGKTRLAHEIRQLGQRRGYLALLGSTHDQEGQSPYAPVIEALRMALRTDPVHADLIPAELAVAIPELPPTASPVPSADRVAAQNALFASVLRFLAARARSTPVILILDDLHVADEGSLKLFHYLARETPNQPLLLVGIWRAQEPGATPGLETLISSLERHNLHYRLPLTPLSGTEHRALVAQVLEGGTVDSRLADAIYRLSEGNPLFAREMVRQLAAADQIALVENTWQFTGQVTDAYAPMPLPPIPASLQALLKGRLAHLSPAALRLLHLAAVVGRDVPFPVLEASLSPTDREVAKPTSLLDLLDEVLATRLLEEAGLNYRFPHPLFRAAIYQELSQARRQALHGQVARALETLYRDDPTMPVEAIAYHYLQVGDVGRAVGYLIQAGDRAEGVYAHDDALQRYAEALSVLEGRIAPDLRRLRAEVQERIGDVYRAIGDVARSVKAYQSALECLTPTPRPTGRLPSPLLSYDRRGEGEQGEWGEAATLHRKIALGAILTTDIATAAEHLARACEILGNDPLEEARWLIAQALFDWHRNALEDAVQNALRALEIAEAAGAQVEVSQACEMLALSYLPLGKWEEGLKYELRRQIAGWSPDVVVATDGHLCLWEYHVHGDEPYRQAEKFIQLVAQHAATLGDLRCVAVCHYALGSMAFLRGQLEPAAHSLAQALELHQRIGSPAGMAYVLARQANLLTARGEAQTGWTLVQQGLETARQAAVWDHCLQRLYGAGIWNRLEAGDLAGAGEIVQAAKTLEHAGRMCTVCSLQMYPALAAFHLATGDLETAWTYAEKTQDLAEMGHNRAGQAQAVRVRGQIHAARGELAEAETCLRQAAEIFRELDQRYDLKETLQIREHLKRERSPSG